MAFGSSVYNTSGGTLSEKNVKEEFSLSESQLSEGIKDGKLTIQWRSFHGNSYRLFIYSEVVAFAKTVEPDPDLLAAKNKKMLKEKLITNKAELEKVTNELNGIEGRKAYLILKKAELEKWMLENDPKTAEAAAKAAAKAAKDEAKAAKAAAKSTGAKRKRT